jgi:hypothetical protein
MGISGVIPAYFDFMLYELVDVDGAIAHYVDRTSSLIYPTDIYVFNLFEPHAYVALRVPNGSESPPSPTNSVASTASTTLGLSRRTPSALDLIAQMARRSFGRSRLSMSVQSATEDGSGDSDSDILDG